MIWYEWLAALALLLCVVQCIAIVVTKILTARTPFPESGGNVQTVQSLGEWDALLGAAILNGDKVLVDCYATWCPPCRAAAPEFGQMSLEYERCKFAKVDVDKAGDVAAQLGVRAMPTFMLFGSPALGCPHAMRLDVVQGWNSVAIRNMLEANGVPRRVHSDPEAAGADDDGDADMGESERLHLVRA